MPERRTPRPAYRERRRAAVVAARLEARLAALYAAAQDAQLRRDSVFRLDGPGVDAGALLTWGELIAVKRPDPAQLLAAAGLTPKETPLSTDPKTEPLSERDALDIKQALLAGVSTGSISNPRGVAEELVEAFTYLQAASQVPSPAAAQRA